MNTPPRYSPAPDYGLTLEERLRWNTANGVDTMPAAAVAPLLDIHAEARNLWHQVENSDVLAGLPEEDCLREVIDMAQSLASGRLSASAMRARARELAEQLDAVQMGLTRCAEFAEDDWRAVRAAAAELGKALGDQS